MENENDKVESTDPVLEDQANAADVVAEQEDMTEAIIEEQETEASKVQPADGIDTFDFAGSFSGLGESITGISDKIDALIKRLDADYGAPESEPEAQEEEAVEELDYTV